MARKKRADILDKENPYGLNEVDDFAAKKEKIILDKAGFNNKHTQDYQRDDIITDDDEEEIMAITDSDDQSEEENNDELNGEDVYKKVFGRKLDLSKEEQEEVSDSGNAWSSTKNEYYGADDLDDDDTAKQIEKEALRQQKKHLEDLNMEDYLDGDIEQEWIKSAKEYDMSQFHHSVSQHSSKTSIKDVLNMNLETKESFLKMSFPEFFPLSKEYNNLTLELEILKSKPGEINRIKIIALSSYLGVIASYFAIFLYEIQNNEDFNSMKDHSIMETILTSKEIWRQASKLQMDVEQFDEKQNFNVEDESQSMSDICELSQEILNVGDNENSNDTLDHVTEYNDIQHNDIDLDIDIDKPRISTVEEISLKGVDDYIESEITEVDAQEKKARKKTLRFYTSKIDQQDKKKIEKFKGDDDIPYKERLYERQQRLLKEARKRGMADQTGSNLNESDDNIHDEIDTCSINNDINDDYYALVKKNKLDSKISRENAHKNAVKAAREGTLAELAEHIDENGKRAINYQILKNKGLTPKRKKENRNARVKKRNKYEKAQKKLKSVRAVYEGGQSGVYEGEKTGIKKNLTKSIKFKS